MGERPICPCCQLTIEPGEEMHPTATPFHVPCQRHDQCYVFCIDSHPDYIAWYEKHHHRKPVQRLKIEGAGADEKV